MSDQEKSNSEKIVCGRTTFNRRLNIAASLWASVLTHIATSSMEVSTITVRTPLGFVIGAGVFTLLEYADQIEHAAQ